MRYRVTDSGLETVGGSHIPVALSFDADEDGYTLTEYWEPRDGGDYTQDIREKLSYPFIYCSIQLPAKWDAIALSYIAKDYSDVRLCCLFLALRKSM